MKKVTKSGRVSIRIKPELRQEINRIISEKKWTITVLLEEALESYLQEQI